jgi:uncharacterized membrane protein YedE/YeeE
MSKIHITKGGANHGPFTVEEINAKLKSGEFGPTDKSWMEGMAGWLPLSDQAFVAAGVVLPVAEAAPPPAEVAPPPAEAGPPPAEPAQKGPSLADKAKAAADQAGSSGADMISKPDANPVVALILTWFVFGLGHMIVNGQTNKWIWTLVMTLVGYVLCFIPGFIIGILSVIDAYQTAVRLKNGETIGQNEYSFPLLYKICKILDKNATCKNA